MVAKKYKNLILDMDGVLWLGDLEIDSLSEIFSEIIKKEIKYFFATNNSTKLISDYHHKLSNFGIPVTEKIIYTSGIATRNYLSINYPKGINFYVIGSPALKSQIENAGFRYSTDEARFVVVGLDVGFNYEKLTVATHLINNGADFIGTNPDLTFPLSNHVNPGAGSIVASVQAATGKVPRIIGKPNSNIYDAIILDHHLKHNDTLVVGDRLDTDILGGNLAGFDTALVLTGISNEETYKQSDISPNLIVDSLSALMELL